MHKEAGMTVRLFFRLAIAYTIPVGIKVDYLACDLMANKICLPCFKA